MTDDTSPADGPAVTEVPAPEAEASASPRGVLLAAVVAVILLAVAAAWFLSGDGDDEQDTATGAEVPELDGRRFTVAAITEGGEARPVIDATASRGGGSPIMAFTDVQVSVSGCNGAGGSYRLDGDRLVVEVGPSTTMACVDPPEGEDPGSGRSLMDQDAWFATFFEAGPIVAADGDDVTLTTSAAEVRLTPLAEPEPASLWGNRWELVSIGEGDTASSPASVDGSVPVLDTATEGQVGFTGCNSGSGSASIEGDVLVVTDLAMTEMACAGPSGDALMELDATMSSLLTARPSFAIEGDQLTLSAEATTATFRRIGTGSPSTSTPVDPDAPVSSEPGSGGPATSAPAGGGSSPGSPGIDLWGSAWEITELCPGAVGADGCAAPVATSDGSAPVLDLTTGGRVGYTGCNGGGADASLVTGDDGTPVLDVGPVVSTKMACAGGDGEALMAQDAALGALLEAGPSVTVDGDRLTLATADAGSLVATRRP